MAVEPVAVVLPLHVARLDPQGQVAVSTLRRHLPDVPRFIVAPRGLAPEFDVSDFGRIDFDPASFASRDSYNTLMLMPEFYAKFDSYESILIYQLDCALFRGDLLDWCARGYSYIGAPWLGRHLLSGRRYPKAVGNGGLSLRRVRDCLAVLASRDCALWPRSAAAWRHFSALKHARRLLRFARDLSGEPGGVAACFKRPEDEFWGYYAPQLWPQFRLPDPHLALDFAIESRGPEMVAANGGRLPFGIHAWALHDPDFWRARLDEVNADAIPGAGSG